MKPVERQELGRVLERLGQELAERHKQSARSDQPWQVQPVLKRHVAGHLADSLLKGKIADSDLRLLRGGLRLRSSLFHLHGHQAG